MGDDDLPYQSLSPEANGENGHSGPYDYAARGYLPTGRRNRHSRWDPDVSPTIIPGFPRVLPNGLTKEQLDALLVRLRIEELTRKLTTNNLEEGLSRDRSPSPEPIYDTGTGKRLNTREQRLKDKYTKDRQKYVTEALQMNPLFRPPADYTPPSQKKTKKIYIPVKEYPEYNFIGLIIGPRGNTQKRMERDTGAKIAIRGKGALKEGKQNKQQYHDDDELHVLVTADSEDQLEKAALLVKELLVPVEEGKNRVKQMQLRELALINGTLREGESWNINQRTWDAADIKCEICGDGSHPTRDCPVKGTPGAAIPPPKTIDAEYESFLAEIGEKKPAPPPAPAAPPQVDDTEKSYEEFMAALNEVTPAKPNPQAAMKPPPAFPPRGLPGQFPFPGGPPPPFFPQGFPPAPFGFPPQRPPFPGASPYGPPAPFGFPPGAGRGFPPPGGPPPPWAAGGGGPGGPGAPPPWAREGPPPPPGGGAPPPWAR